jgi:hypothetical protein
MKKDKRGGSRPGAGRPEVDTKTVHISIDIAAYNIIEPMGRRKGEYVSKAILEYWKKT